MALRHWAARHLGALTAPYEALDTTAVPLRNPKRRGAGALPEVAALGKSLRLGWFAGARLLLAVTPEGAVTGWGAASGNAQDRALAEAFFAQSALPTQALPSVGRALRRPRLRAPAARQRRAPAGSRRWSAGARQIVETVFQRLLQGFRLERERPLGGRLTRIAARAC